MTEDHGAHGAVVRRGGPGRDQPGWHRGRPGRRGDDIEARTGTRHRAAGRDARSRRSGSRGPGRGRRRAPAEPTTRCVTLATDRRSACGSARVGEVPQALGQRLRRRWCRPGRGRRDRASGRRTASGRRPATWRARTPGRTPGGSSVSPGDVEPSMLRIRTSAWVRLTCSSTITVVGEVHPMSRNRAPSPVDQGNRRAPGRTDRTSVGVVAQTADHEVVGARLRAVPRPVVTRPARPGTGARRARSPPAPRSWWCRPRTT